MDADLLKMLERDREVKKVCRQHARELDHKELLEMICIAAMGGYGDGKPASVSASFETGEYRYVTIRVSWPTYRDYLLAEAYKRMKGNHS